MELEKALGLMLLVGIFVGLAGFLIGVLIGENFAEKEERSKAALSGWGRYQVDLATGKVEFVYGRKD